MVVGGFEASPAVRSAIDFDSPKRERHGSALVRIIGYLFSLLWLRWVVVPYVLVWLACRPRIVLWYWL
jgi:hypothetical protein